jgi:hypothetical protein
MIGQATVPDVIQLWGDGILHVLPSGQILSSPAGCGSSGPAMLPRRPASGFAGEDRSLAPHVHCIGATAPNQAYSLEPFSSSGSSANSAADIQPG